MMAVVQKANVTYRDQTAIRHTLRFYVALVNVHQDAVSLNMAYARQDLDVFLKKQIVR